jgi:hypothetical protein
MNGPAHYLEAERLLTAQHQCLVTEDSGGLCLFCISDVARAQVHAMLALAAATADPFCDGPTWAEAAR